MLTEQEKVINNFRNAHSRKEKLIIYGTGVNAEAIVKQCRDFPIVGIMDVAKTGQMLCGLPILSEEEIVELHIKKIVIVARPTVHSIIYKRIEKFVVENHISVYDIYGNDVSKKDDKIETDHMYFHVSYEDLWKCIEEHEVVSFDIFDTLLCRKTYQPQDVFLLMKSKDILEDFSQVREKAGADGNVELNIYEIYESIKNQCHLSNEESEELLSREISKEKQVLCVRHKMVECLKQCINIGKEVYLVSDMYIPKDLLESILLEYGVEGYRDLLISCEYRVSKENGLFEVLKSHCENRSCLHIGDNHERDIVCAVKAGIDAFEIANPIYMMEISTYKSLLRHTTSLEDRTLLGILASELFNDPFSLYESKGKPYVNQNYLWGYIYISPLMVAFTSWLMIQLKGEKDALILFAARDGFLFQKIYELIKELLILQDLPGSRYLFISRRAVQEDAIASNGYRKYLEKLGIGEVGKLFFFDFMSKGSCQLGLQKGLGQELSGVYVQRSFCSNLELDQLSVQAFYTDESAMESKRYIFAMCDFLECIFTSFDPSFIKVEDGGKVVCEKEVRSNEQLAMVNEIQTAVMDFSKLFFEIYGKLPTEFRTPDLCDAILNVSQRKYTRINLPEMEQMILDDAYGICKNTGKDIFQ